MDISRLIPTEIGSTLLVGAALGATALGVVVFAGIRWGIRYWQYAQRRHTMVKSQTEFIRIITKRDFYSAIVVAHHDPAMNLVRGAGQGTLGAWLQRIGFSVSLADDVAVVREGLDLQPTLVAVDFSLSPNMVGRIEQVFSAVGIDPGTTVVFFNAPMEGENLRSDFLTQFSCVGEIFDDQDMLRIVAPLLDSDNGVMRYDIALQGEIHEDGLSELLHLVEMGRRSGSITIRNAARRVVGFIEVDEGLIVHVRTASFKGMDGLMILAGMTSGHFQMRSERRTKDTNCSIMPNAALLMAAKNTDDRARDVQDVVRLSQAFDR
jgi:hypothetical protein